MATAVDGYPLRPREPAYTQDERFWDGTRTYRLVDDDVAKRQGVLLSAAEVVVLAPTDCCPGPCPFGTKTILDEEARRRLATAGFVRFREPEGSLQRWEADDGTVLALLVGEVTRPALD